MEETCAGSFSNWTSPSCADGHRMTGAGAVLFTTLISSLLDEQCQIGDPSIYPADATALLPEYDFIVVGAGSAGSVVASRLSEVSNWTVLLLEAGGDPPPESDIPGIASTLWTTSIDWNYKTQPEEQNCRGFIGRRCTWPRGKVLGGSSSVNGLIYLRGFKQDYDNWEMAGNSGWSYNDVLPYFKKSEDLRSKRILSTPNHDLYHSTGGYQTVDSFHYDDRLADSFLKSGQELGYTILEDFDANESIGFGQTQGTVREGERCGTAKAFLSPAKGRSNLHVVKYAYVTKILIDANTNKTQGVQFLRNGEMIEITATKEVILSAGAINSPHILMLSGIGPQEHLEEVGISIIKNLQVGRNLQDHVVYRGGLMSVDKNKPCDSTCIKRTLNPTYEYLTKRSGSLSTIGITNLMGFINTNNTTKTDENEGYPNIQIQHVSLQCNNTNDLKIYLRNNDFSKELYDAHIKFISESDIAFQQPALLNPKSRGKILLNSSDPLDYPLIYSGYLSDPSDVETLVSGLEFIVKSMETPALRQHHAELKQLPMSECDQYEFKTRDYWRCAVRQLGTSAYHPVGTCKMGPKEDPDAVVDPKLKVHGIQSLRVVDASIMPTIVSTNTNAPSIMIGEKGADLIKEEWING